MRLYFNIKEGDKHSDVVVQNEGVGVVIEAGSDKQNESPSKNISEGSFFFLKRIGAGLVAGKAEMARSTI